MNRIAAMLERDEPVRWVFAGDSITHGALHTIGWRDYTELFSERLRWELRRHRDLVIKTGISGWKITDLAADLDWNLLQLRPHVVSMMFGMNDCTLGPENVCEFISVYRDVIETIREETGALVVLHTPNPVLPYVGVPRATELATYRDAVLEIARETGTPCIDHFERWQRESEGTLQHWLVDGFHPNEYGHRALARSLFKALGIWDPAGSLTCQLPIPTLPAA